MFSSCPPPAGTPKRLTWHPAPDTVLGWTPDGKRILFSSPRTSYSRFAELFTVGLEGGLEEKVPLPMGYEAAFSPDGAQLAYVPLPRAFTVVEALPRRPRHAHLARHAL